MKPTVFVIPFPLLSPAVPRIYSRLPAPLLPILSSNSTYGELPPAPLPKSRAPPCFREDECGEDDPTIVGQRCESSGRMAGTEERVTALPNSAMDEMQTSMTCQVESVEVLSSWR